MRRLSDRWVWWVWVLYEVEGVCGATASCSGAPYCLLFGRWLQAPSPCVSLLTNTMLHYCTFPLWQLPTPTGSSLAGQVLCARLPPVMVHTSAGRSPPGGMQVDGPQHGAHAQYLDSHVFFVFFTCFGLQPGSRKQGLTGWNWQGLSATCANGSTYCGAPFTLS